MAASIEFETTFLVFLRNQQTELMTEGYTVVNAVWLAETYFYQGVRDLLPEEVERAKEKTSSLEDKLSNVLSSQKRVADLFDSLKEALSKHEFSLTFSDKVFAEKKKWEEEVAKVMVECFSYRREMLERIRESGIGK